MGPCGQRGLSPPRRARQSRPGPRARLVQLVTSQQVASPVDRAELAAAASTSASASPISRRRRLGSFCRQRRINQATRSGVTTGSEARSGSRVITAASTSATDSPSNVRRPASISFSTQPNAQMSARLSIAFPRACSGAMYAAVPRIMPMPGHSRQVRDRRANATGVVTARAAGSAERLREPKIQHLDACRPARTLMLAGLRSRWMIPCSCAASSASAICLAIGSASSSGIGPCAIRSASVGPSTSSSTSAVMPFDSSRP